MIRRFTARTAEPPSIVLELLAVGSACAACVGISLCYYRHGMVDDSFIILRYARHLSGGGGLVWNLGEEPVQGVTCLLWVALIAGFHVATGINLPAIAVALGIASAVVGLVCSWLLSRRVLPLGLRWLAPVAPFALALSPVYPRHAISGLETALVCSLMLVLAWLWSFPFTRTRHLLIIMVCWAAYLVRPDSVLFSVTGTAMVFGIRGAEGRARRLCVFFGTLGALIGLSIALTWIYFGNPLPLPAIVKFGDGLLSGTKDIVLNVILSQGIFLNYAGPFVLMIVLALTDLRWDQPLPAVAAIEFIIVLVYLSVISTVMNFDLRYEMPVLCLLIIAGVVCTIEVFHILFDPRLSHDVVHWLLLPLVLLLLSFNFGWFSSIRHSADALDRVPRQCYRILGEALHPIEGITIAGSEAGALPYYSEKNFLDLVGLNSPFIAEHFRDRDFSRELERRLSAGPLPDIYFSSDAYPRAALAAMPEVARQYDLIGDVASTTMYVLRSSPHREDILAAIKPARDGNSACGASR